MKHIILSITALLLCLGLSAQKYKGVVDKTVAIVGGETILISDIEAQIQEELRSGRPSSDRDMRCEVLESMLDNKLFLMQARVDSLTVNNEMVQSNLSQPGGIAPVAQEGRTAVVEGAQSVEALREVFDHIQSLIEQERSTVASKIPEITPYDVKKYIENTDPEDLPVVPVKYQLSQICLYPDRAKAALSVKEKLLSLRERIMNGEKFSTLARIYSEDPASARRGGELGLASKTIFWPEFSDAAMSLKVGMVSNTVETPDGFHLIQVIEKKGDMFNARHILIKPKYTSADREKAFARLDSLRALIDTTDITFEMAARMYSEDKASKTNGGQMADPMTGSAYFDKDQIKPADWAVVRNLKPGDISEPVESTDNEGRGNLVYKIIRLDKIVDSHAASFETDYNDLYSTVEHLKQVEAINKFIDDKIKETHIVIDPMFKDCDFSRAGWSEKIRK